MQVMTLLRWNLPELLTDGTIQGTFHVADINPGLVESHLKFIVQYNTVILFHTTTAEHRTVLWRSDGTLEKTKLVEDIVCEVGSSTPQYLLSFNGFVSFTAFSNDYGVELWFSDGFARSDFSPDHSGKGTEMTADINPGKASSNPKYLVKTTTYMYFQANDGIHGTAPSGTYSLKEYLLKDITESSNPSDLIEYYDKVYFQTDDGLYGTYCLMDLRSTVFHPRKLYFTANTGVYGRTPAGTYRALSDSGPRDIDMTATRCIFRLVKHNCRWAVSQAIGNAAASQLSLTSIDLQTESIRRYGCF